MTELTVSETEPGEAGKGGEGGVLMITNADFVAAVFPSVPEGAFAAVCSKAGDPGVGGWVANRADSVIANLSAVHNNFVGCSSFYPGEDGSFLAYPVDTPNTLPIVLRSIFNYYIQCLWCGNRISTE